MNWRNVRILQFNKVSSYLMYQQFTINKDEREINLYFFYKKKYH